MKNYASLFNGSCQKPNPTSCGCDSVKGNAIELDVRKDDCEIRADVIVGRTSGVRVWGQVKDCNGYPVANALVKLVKVVINCGRQEIIGVAHTITDCTGFYQFEISCCETGAKYRVLVHKAAEGKERTVSQSAALCNPCAEPSPCNPNPNPCPCE